MLVAVLFIRCCRAWCLIDGRGSVRRPWITLLPGDSGSSTTKVIDWGQCIGSRSKIFKSWYSRWTVVFAGLQPRIDTVSVEKMLARHDAAIFVVLIL